MRKQDEQDRGMVALLLGLGGFEMLASLFTQETAPVPQALPRREKTRQFVQREVDRTLVHN